LGGRRQERVVERWCDMKLLIADDNEQNLYMLQALLEGNGYEVVTARHGAEALEAARDDPPDLIISDILMPVMDGFALCREWKKDERLSGIPFIFYTATYTDPKDEEFALKLGAERFIVKPQEPDVFAGMVREVLENGKAGQLVSSPGPAQEETAYFKEYNAVLIRKLEDKLVQLEQANQALQAEVAERQRAQETLREYTERLEEMVEERTRELREAQEDLVRKERMAALGQIAGAMGHELRNPLGAIKNAAYFLKMVGQGGWGGEELDPEVRQTLEILEREVNRSERIVSDLLHFARSGRPARRRVDLNEVVWAALALVVVPPSVEVVDRLAESLPNVSVDPDQLVLVFGNIIRNAIQAMPEGGRLTVVSEQCSARGGPEAEERLPAGGLINHGCVQIAVSDTGVGIEKENLERVFEPLFTTKAKGFGLGLALARRLVEGHGGTIVVVSAVGDGSTFTVRLPLADVKREE